MVIDINIRNEQRTKAEIKGAEFKVKHQLVCEQYQEGIAELKAWIEALEKAYKDRLKQNEDDYFDSVLIAKDGNPLRAGNVICVGKEYFLVKDRYQYLFAQNLNPRIEVRKLRNVDGIPKAISPKKNQTIEYYPSDFDQITFISETLPSDLFTNSKYKV